ncbi:MAG: PhoH family protein [Lentisphaeria bacterium]|nr:PhoH family protein [Lentisphaeria bacterium]
MNAKAGKIKTFVLDTNVLLHSSQSMESFRDNDVVIPMAVIEELDKFKKNSDELGRNARAVIRNLDRLRQITPDTPGQLTRGVALEHLSGAATGRLYVLSSPIGTAAAAIGREVDSVFGGDLERNSPDNRILRVACDLRDKGRNVVFISKDINLRLKADALGLMVMDFERGKVNEASLYTGVSSRSIPAAELEKLFRDKELPAAGSDMLVNECAVLSSADNPKRTALVRRCRGDVLRLLRTPESVWNISPRNKEQRMAFDLLLDPDVKLVTLVGGAGTGKTLLALAAALHLVLNENLYDRILVSRPIIPLGNDIGFLPGSKDSKLASWMQPIFDNLELLLGGESERKPKSSSRYSTEGLMAAHKLELEALTYIRGRSIPRQIVIVDEAQNLTPHEVKTIVSRCGDDTKMVLTGDPAQIDNPYLDASSNGLSCAAERMKGQELFGHITLAKSERSTLAALAAELL